MSINREEALRLLNMSGLSLSDEQVESVRADLDNIIGYVSQLDELDTENVEPTYQVFEMENVWREDEIEKFEAGRDELLALAAETVGNQIRVPKVL